MIRSPRITTYNQLTALLFTVWILKINSYQDIFESSGVNINGRDWVQFVRSHSSGESCQLYPKTCFKTFHLVTKFSYFLVCQEHNLMIKLSISLSLEKEKLLHDIFLKASVTLLHNCMRVWFVSLKILTRLSDWWKQICILYHQTLFVYHGSVKLNKTEEISAS